MSPSTKPAEPISSVEVGPGTDYNNWFADTDPSFEALAFYVQFLSRHPQLLAILKRDLRGKTLTCTCTHRFCHRGLLEQIANE